MQKLLNIIRTFKKQTLQKAELSSVAWNPSVHEDPYFEPASKESGHKMQQLFTNQRVLGMINANTPVFQVGNNDTTDSFLHELYTPRNHAQAANILKNRLTKMNSHYKLLDQTQKLENLPNNFFEDVDDLQNQIELHTKKAKGASGERVVVQPPLHTA